MAIDWEQYRATDNPLPNNASVDWEQYRAPDKSDQAPPVDTFLGKMPETTGNPYANPEMINQLMNAAALGPTGMEVLGTGAATALNFGKGIKSVLTKIVPKDLAYAVQKGHDTLMNQASDIYNFVKSEVVPRGVSKIDIPSDVIDQAESALSKTRANKMLIDNARSGDYNALHNLQSDLGKLGRKKLGSDLVAENNEGEEILDNRSKINESIRDRFREYGHDDLANMLDDAQSKWAKLKDTYYSHPTIAKLVGEETRKIPSNPIKTFSEESKPMSKLLDAHPEVKDAVETSKNADNFMKKLKLTGKIGLGAFGLHEGYNLLNLVKNKLGNQ